MWCPYYSTCPPCVPSIPPLHVFPPPFSAHPPPHFSIPSPISHSVPPLCPSPWPPQPCSTSQTLCLKPQTPIDYSFPSPPPPYSSLPLTPSSSTPLSSLVSKSGEVESVSSQLAHTEKLCSSFNDHNPHVRVYDESSKSCKSNISSIPVLSIPLPLSQMPTASFHDSPPSPSKSVIHIESPLLPSIETDIKPTVSSLSNSRVEIKCNTDLSIDVASYAATSRPTSGPNALLPVDSQSHTKLDEKIDVDSSDHALYIKKIEEFISQCKNKSKPCYNSEAKDEKLKSGAIPSSDFAFKYHENQSSSLSMKSKGKSSHTRHEDVNFSYSDLYTPSKDVSDKEAWRTLVYLHGKECKKYKKHPKRHPRYESELKLWNEHMSSKGFDIHHHALKTEWKVCFRNLVNVLQAQKWEQAVKHFYSIRQHSKEITGTSLIMDKEENSSALTLSSSSLFKHVSFRSPNKEQKSSENEILNREISNSVSNGLTIKNKKKEKTNLKEEKHAKCKNVNENDQSTLSNSNKRVVKEEIRDINGSISNEDEEIKQKINPPKNCINEKVDPIFSDLSSSINKKDITTVIESLPESDCSKKSKPVSSSTDFIEENLPLQMKKSSEITLKVKPIDKRKPSNSNNEESDPIDLKIKASTSNIGHNIKTIISERFENKKNVSIKESRSLRFQNHIVIKCDKFLKFSNHEGKKKIESGHKFDGSESSFSDGSEPVSKLNMSEIDCGKEIEFAPTNKSGREKVLLQTKHLTQNKSNEKDYSVQKVPLQVECLNQNKSKEQNDSVQNIPLPRRDLTLNKSKEKIDSVQKVPLETKHLTQNKSKKENDSIQKVPLPIRGLPQNKSKEKNDSVLNGPLLSKQTQTAQKVPFLIRDLTQNVDKEQNNLVLKVAPQAEQCLTQNDSLQKGPLPIRDLIQKESKEKKDLVPKVPLQAKYLTHDKSKEQNDSHQKVPHQVRQLTHKKSKEKNEFVQKMTLQTNQLTLNESNEENEQIDSVQKVCLPVRDLTQNKSKKKVNSGQKVPSPRRDLIHNKSKEKNISVQEMTQGNQLTQNKSNEKNDLVQKVPLQIGDLTQSQSMEKDDSVRKVKSSDYEFDEKISPILPIGLSKCDFYEIYSPVQKEALSEIDNNKKESIQIIKASSGDCNKAAPPLKLYSPSSKNNKNNEENDAKIESASETDEPKRKYIKNIKTIQERHISEDYKMKTAKKSSSKLKDREIAPIQKNENDLANSWTESSQEIKKLELKFEALPKLEKQCSKAKDLVSPERNNKPQKRIKESQNIMEKNLQLSNAKYSDSRKREEIIGIKKKYRDQHKREFETIIPKPHKTLKDGDKIKNDKIKCKSGKNTVVNEETNQHCDKRINKINNYEQKGEMHEMRKVNRSKSVMEMGKCEEKKLEDSCERKEKQSIVMKDDFLRKRKRENSPIVESINPLSKKLHMGGFLKGTNSSSENNMKVCVNQSDISKADFSVWEKVIEKEISIKSKSFLESTTKVDIFSSNLKGNAKFNESDAVSVGKVRENITKDDSFEINSALKKDDYSALFLAELNVCHSLDLDPTEMLSIRGEVDIPLGNNNQKDELVPQETHTSSDLNCKEKQILSSTVLGYSVNSESECKNLNENFSSIEEDVSTECSSTHGLSADERSSTPPILDLIFLLKQMGERLDSLAMPLSILYDILLKGYKDGKRDLISLIDQDGLTLLSQIRDKLDSYLSQRDLPSIRKIIYEQTIQDINSLIMDLSEQKNEPRRITIEDIAFEILCDSTQGMSCKEIINFIRNSPFFIRMKGTDKDLLNIYMRIRNTFSSSSENTL